MILLYDLSLSSFIKVWSTLNVFLFLFARRLKNVTNFTSEYTCISWIFRVFFTTTPPHSSLEIADLKHSNISKGKFQEKFTVHGHKLQIFLFILLTIVSWDKWYLKAFSSSNVCFFTTALDNCKILLLIWLAKAFFSPFGCGDLQPHVFQRLAPPSWKLAIIIISRWFLLAGTTVWNGMICITVSPAWVIPQDFGVCWSRSQKDFFYCVYFCAFLVTSVIAYRRPSGVWES